MGERIVISDTANETVEQIADQMEISKKAAASLIINGEIEP